MMESIPNLNEARLKIVYPQIADLPLTNMALDLIL